MARIVSSAESNANSIRSSRLTSAGPPGSPALSGTTASERVTASRVTGPSIERCSRSCADDAGAATVEDVTANDTTANAARDALMALPPASVTAPRGTSPTRWRSRCADPSATTARFRAAASASSTRAKALDAKSVATPERRRGARPAHRRHVLDARRTDRHDRDAGPDAGHHHRLPGPDQRLLLIEVREQQRGTFPLGPVFSNVR